MCDSTILFAAALRPRSTGEGAAIAQDVSAPARVVVYATTSSRLGAYLLDAVLLGVLAFGVVAVLSFLLGPTIRFNTAADLLSARVIVDDGRALVDSVVTTAASGLYFVASWFVTAGSPGQLAFGMRVMPVGGGRVSLRAGIVRWAALGGPAAPLIVATGIVAPVLRLSLGAVVVVWQLLLLVSTIRSATHQGIHDRLAGTVVVQDARIARATGAD